MRPVLVSLLIFCAVISGWTAALAQMRHATIDAPIHQAGPVHNAGSAGAHAHHDDAAEDCGDACHQSGKGVHPILCAACFALESEPASPARAGAASVKLMPTRQTPMTAAIHTPRSPPPKTSLVA